jgi:penicillin-binding protein 1B
MLPISIGAEETTLLDLTAAYQPFASGGTRSPAYAIESVSNVDGSEIYRHEGTDTRVVDPAVAYLMTGALKMVLKSGTGASAGQLGLDFPAAGKTGTTQDYKDAYFVGYTPELVCGVWVGFDAPQSIGLTGAQAALPPWVQIMQRSAVFSPQDFAVPPGIVMERVDPESGGLATSSCGKRVTLPFLPGTQPTDFCPLHGGDGSTSVYASNRNWGGWKSNYRPVARQQEERKPAGPNVFSKVGKFFGSLFHRR